ncbi:MULTISPECIES: MFS transporter [Streptomyces]|uniref:2-acyl-glycerophospho-ethanolamine acyltransferase n=2 Tax=Streptomyces TaxID=1883 RepID=A0A1D8FX70_9ACTN|nr:MULTISPECIES: MFS transporter [Streptomyces]AOT57803.1 2-acyl-glycerophospho-ethanolamine acyltransferase [Streptomyces rubrolavendulae]KAF0651745.1 MFS transporter [Streptomyces fradiae ATCC 10745 = DSM 40063]OSY50801.1 2-acyl-glycerophospho-ethanolamine acyltransferase [Streptomyces fradiae ATCC 10745 = DSM 40063]QEV11170.1 MFS transporter [Streptomyces fradiae ATCC 10745 = DSM 40063]
MRSPAASPRTRSGRRPGWAGRNYVLLTAAAVITNVGSHGALVAAAFAVLDSGGDGGDVGLVAAARTLPLVLFLLVGGAVADRLPRHRVMVAANTLNCVSQALFAFLVLTGRAELWHMMVLTALCGTGQAFFNPAAEGMLLSSVRGEQASRAFALFRMAMSGAGIGGAALGGALVAAFGPGWVLAVDAAAFAVAGALRAFLDVRHIPVRRPGGGLLSDLREGWDEVVGRPWLWAVVAQFSVVVAVVGAAESVYGPLVAQESLGGARPWGLALAAFGVGTLGGALLMTRWKPRRLLLVGTVCVFPLALPSAALAVPLPAVGLAAVMLVSGLAIEVFGVAWMTSLHQEIPEEKLSRVAAYDWFGSTAMLPLSTALAGPVADLVGRSRALWGCSALIVVVTALVLLVPDVRNLTLRTEGAGADRPQEPPVPAADATPV